ncbi:MAG TPA: glycoside hydrolase family 38 C-terminal domain-containing protein [Gemmatimonadales bacterium]|nr:glycoside hydrolase family 38 C-terminal domain-containing protein [Gemmatimonadales bacterium]
MPGYTFHLIPHTHWDREWYLPQSIFLARLVRTLDDLLIRLDAEPELTFLLDGQTVLVEDYLRVRPEREARVSELVRAGRLQVGPWYVLADELIPSGESLIRNLLAGQSDARRLGGRTDVLYSPDAFGHPASLPQLAGEFGIRYGVAWRGLGGERDQQHDLYRWRAPDGREILLYHLPPDGYEVGAGLTADPERLRRIWARVRSSLVERALTRQVAVFIGADHHAVHPAVIALRSRLAELEADGEVRISRLHDFFAAASMEASGASVLDGELRWSYDYTWTLQGVHATRAPLKRRHSQAELWLTGIADPIAALTRVTAGADHRPMLNQAWRLLLQSQFHDSIAGCTSDAVARRVETRVEDARALAAEVARVGLNQLIGNDTDRVRDQPDVAEPQLILWNPVPRSRSAVVVADLSWFRRDVLVGPPGDRMPRIGPARRPFHLIAGGKAMPVQLLGETAGHERLDSDRHYPDQDEVDWTRVAFQTPTVDGFGVTSAALGQGSRMPAGAASVGERALRNEFLELRIGTTGTLDLTDRVSKQRYSDLLSVESGGDEGDTYTYSPPPGDQLRRNNRPAAVRALAAGPLVAALELRWSLAAGRARRGGRPGEVAIRLIVSLYAGSPVVRCSVEIDNQARNHRLRVRLPTGLPGGFAVAGGQFGPVERFPVHFERHRHTREVPVTTAPAHRYVARAVKNRGLALLAPGFFEYEFDPEGNIIMTLLRAVGQLSREDLATRPGHAGWPVSTPLAQCPGTDRVQLGIAPLTQPQLESGTRLAQLWEDLFLPIQPVWLRQASPLSLPSLSVRLDGDGLVFSGMKPAESGDAVVLRCYNATESPTAGAWQLSDVVRTAHRARADEQALHEIRLGEGSRSVPFHAGPHEIVTIMVTLSMTG